MHYEPIELGANVSKGIDYSRPRVHNIKREVLFYYKHLKNELHLATYNYILYTTICLYVCTYMHVVGLSSLLPVLCHLSLENLIIVPT